MKRYLLFNYDQYYPFGGWEDFQGDFDSIAEAQSYHAEKFPKGHFSGGYAHIVDTETKEIILSRRYSEVPSIFGWSEWE